MQNIDYRNEELENLEQKLKYTETAQDLFYILDRLCKVINNDSELGEHLRSFVSKNFQINK